LAEKPRTSHSVTKTPNEKPKLKKKLLTASKTTGRKSSVTVVRFSLS